MGMEFVVPHAANFKAAFKQADLCMYKNKNSPDKLSKLMFDSKKKGASNLYTLFLF